MYFYFDPMYTAVNILTESENASISEQRNIQTILEDTESPITNKYLEKLYDSVVSKSHIDFDDIPNSKGNIVEYKGYTNMIEVLENVLKLASDNRSQNVIDYVNSVKEAIANMRALAPIYRKGFMMRNDYVMLEYNTFVYTIIQAVSTILYEFVDYVKRPEKQTFDIVLKNNKYRANTFYIDQLRKFNMINKKMNYSAYLQSMITNGRDNFTGATAIGIGFVVAVALAIVPVTRELVYRFYNTKAKISDALAQQAYFLEMNKACVEANGEFSQQKKDEILLKQERIKNLCLRIADKLRVDHIKSVNAGKAMIRDENKLLTLDGIKKEVNDSPLQLL